MRHSLCFYSFHVKLSVASYSINFGDPVWIVEIVEWLAFLRWVLARMTCILELPFSSI